MLQPDQAAAIVATFHTAGLLEPPLPTDEAEIMRVATEILGAAQRAKGVGSTNEVVEQVIALAEPGSTPPWDENDLTNVVKPDTTEVQSIATPEQPISADVPPPTETIAAEEGTAAASTDATPLESDQEKEPSSPLPALPRDFSLLSDVELRSWHARLHADYAQIVHELGIEEADYESAQVLHAQAQKIAMSKVASDKVTDRREKAAVDPEVMDWAEKQDGHHKKVILFRAYEKIVDRQITGLSREFTMRTTERTNTP